ncbi:MAG TPA: tetratricopeptide repeat protein [Terriglobales bacterium]|nr:tetratricopeptide repeat protein [Terriglobales bacterium]
MKRHSALIVLLALALCAAPMWAQFTATLKGVALDREGKPITDGVVEAVNMESGQKYSLKTNKKGEFFTLGIQPGKYKITLYENGQQLFYWNNTRLNPEENVINFKLNELAAQQQQNAQAQMTPEQKAQQEAVQKENAKVGNLNNLLAGAKAAKEAGNLDQAITLMQQATQADPNRDLLWGALGGYQLDAAKKATDTAARNAIYASAAESFQKAIALCGANPSSRSCQGLGGYHNNYGQALANSGKTDEAIAEYNAAAQVDPAGAAQYYYNLGAVLTNHGKVDEANAAFDKAIAADPNKAEAYYQKGVNLLGKATIDKDGKMVAPPEAAKSIEKYLELQPQGPFAADAKTLLDSMGQTVQTSFGNTSRKPKGK